MKASIVIRTYNEEKHLGDLLQAVHEQECDGIDREVVVVDSGSTDRTREIAHSFGSKVTHIRKEEFSFGHSLNIGCEAATGDHLVFISGHCVPASRTWLRELVAPLGKNRIAYTYGIQLGNGSSRFSECQLFAKYYPNRSQTPQEGFFCNNANAALSRNIWLEHRFDEELTGLEDMHLAARLLKEGYKIGYVAEAPVFHLHEETWTQVRRRFEREAIALQHIMPEVHINFLDFLRYFASAVMLDVGAALQQRKLTSNAGDIILFRLMQFWGSYRGNHFHRQLSKRRKEAYFYPR